jgi:hypothetical protein
MELREKVAKAMYTQYKYDTDIIGHRDPAWEQTYPHFRKTFLKYANVAIKIIVKEL